RRQRGIRARPGPCYPDRLRGGREGRRRRGRVHALRARLPEHGHPDLTTVREPTPLMSPGPTDELQAVLDQGKAKVDAAGVEGEYVWAFGDPGRVIVDAARDHGATRIVIGADHHGFLDRLLGGNVEAEVRREADCEIVVVE